MIFDELEAMVPMSWVEEEAIDGLVTARDLVPYEGKISWDSIESFAKNVTRYNELLYNGFADGHLGHNPFPG